MLDIQFIRENIELMKKTCVSKGGDSKIIELLLDADSKRRELIGVFQELKTKQNEVSKKIPQMKGDEKEKALNEMKFVSAECKEKEEKLKDAEKTFQSLMLQMPQPVIDKVPEGKDDSENVEIKKWGESRKFDFPFKDHVELGTNLDIIDIPRGVKIAGSRFYFLKGAGALLENAVLQYTLEKLVKKGFTPMIVPLLVHYDAMMGTSYFPGGEEQAYAIEKDNAYLIGTSEVAVTSYHQGELLEEKDLPKKYCGMSPCFRREAGTYGKDTHGLYRIHQFQKIEQVIVCKNDPEESMKMHNEILQNAEEVLQALQLPYRVVDVCTGDIGQGQVYKNDIETWMPSRNSYGETHSCSTFWEFQARRLNLKYKDSEGNKQFCHTLNNTCIASPRVLIPILETYQNEDGSITVPEVLRKYMCGIEKITS